MRLAPIVGVVSTLALTILVSTATALPTDPVTEKIGRWCEGPDPPIAYKEHICARLHRAKEERRAARLAAAQVEVAPVAPPAPVTVAPAPVTSSGGCVGMEAESGSAGYAATPTGPYIGCYQISADHFNGGSCSGLSTDPAGQDACASIICNTEGAGAWTNPAGENPCGRL